MWTYEPWDPLLPRRPPTPSLPRRTPGQSPYETPWSPVSTLPSQGVRPGVPTRSLGDYSVSPVVTISMTIVIVGREVPDCDGLGVCLLR